jgi:putative flippase GtrA
MTFSPGAEGQLNDRLKRDFIQFVKFCFVGGSGVIVNLAVFNVTLLAWHTGGGGTPRAAIYLGNALGFVVSVLTNYYLNRRWTFRSTGAVSRELPRFFAVSVIAYVVNLGILTFCLSVLHLGANPSQIVAIACVMPINFILNKLWSFKSA